ncbi:tubulin polymerization-promoting protein homolog [Vespa mandarinia]|uniref:tubulin polymerization-promoting protein homolog n=1 Tax=Vespa mandarinia TaxID=7446 RepID=UPI00160AC6A7|nr:tubulin polymerization-promoting protein homolog [Vespa mandarinia]
MDKFESQFIAYAKYSKSKSGGKRITLSQSDKWMRQAEIFNDKITQADTALHFNDLHREALDIEDYKKFIINLAKAKHLDPHVIQEKMIKCGPPIEDRSRVESVVLEKIEDPSGYI